MIKTAIWRTWQKDTFDKKLDENENKDTIVEQHSPIIRIHPPVERITPQGSPSMTKWSPAITRTHKDNDILFELPPLAPGRFAEAQPVQLQIDPMYSTELNRTRSMSVAVPSRSQFLGGNNISQDEKSPVKTHQRSVSIDARDLKLRISSELQPNNWLGKIEPELYKAPSECRSRCGRVWFSLVYDGAIESLMIKVIKVKQLPSRSTSEEIPRDSFVKVFLLPDEKHSHQTKVRHRCNNPVFNETFTFQVPNSDIRQRILRLSVYDEEKRKSSRNLLGHALVHLDDLDFSKANEEMWRDLDDIAKPGDTGSSLGDVNIALSYIPSAEKLSVVVKEAKNLRKIDLDATGVYVKVALYQGNRVIKTKKTSTKVGVTDPKYNESFYYKITAEDMEQTSLLFTVVTRAGYGALNRLTATVKCALTGGRYGVENKYGKVTIGSTVNSRGEQLIHWQEILSQSHHQAQKSIAKWHALSEIVDDS